MMQSEESAKPVKQLTHRYEGIAKVTGKAKYAAEFSQPFSKADLTYVYIVQSTIPSGTIVSINRAAANRSSGVIAILTPAIQCTEAEPRATPSTGSSQPQPLAGQGRPL
jgi:xanthine dehydrogenase YagR molybdenum-binding subunit